MHYKSDPEYTLTIAGMPSKPEATRKTNTSNRVRINMILTIK